MIREEQRDIESTKYAEGIVEKTDAWANYPLSKRMECRQFDGYHLAEACMCGMEWADAHPAWVSVEDDLPKEGEKVYIYTKNGSVGVAQYKNKEWNISHILAATNVTHWMHIIPPIKEEQ